MKLLGSFNVYFSQKHRMRIPITRALYDAVQQENNPLIITGYTASGACLFSYMSCSGNGYYTYKDGEKRRWEGNGYRTPEFDNTWGSCWRDSRKISITPDYINFHKMPYESECMTAVVTLEAMTTNGDIHNIQL